MSITDVLVTIVLYLVGGLTGVLIGWGALLSLAVVFVMFKERT
jgi:hypothetical protein